MIRTQELLNARKIDGGHQFFSRAIDFGFSKTPEETLKVWDKDEILGDVVWAIRKHRPDVIINRFDHRTSGNTHGHHTSSAILSVEAFDLAGKENAYPDQLSYVKPWNPNRAFFNTSWWFFGSEEAFEKADKSNFIELEINKFYPLEGLSNNEISALSRSEHKSQGFGNTGTRGERNEYIELLKGEPLDGNDPFAGVDTSWNRIPEGKGIGKILKKVEKNFNFKEPWNSVPQLLKAKTLIDKIEDDFWREQKSEQIEKIIIACLGLFVEARHSTPYATPGESLDINFEVINRSPTPIKLVSISHSDQSINATTSQLKHNLEYEFSTQLVLNSEENFTTPYWLTEQAEIGIYKVADQNLIGKPETPKPIEFTFEFDIDGTLFRVKKPLIYKYNDPVKGEVYQNFEILPEASVSLKEAVYVFKNSDKKFIDVNVKTFVNDLSGELELSIPQGWNVMPAYHKVDLRNKGASESYTFEITPTTEGETTLFPVLKFDTKTLNKKVSTIDYEHIGTHNLVQESSAKLVNLDIEISNKKIAYIIGAGSSVPSNLKDLGFDVQVLRPSEITSEILSNFDVVLMGIRTYNIHEELTFKQDLLFEFVENGGTMIVQYNTSRGLKTNKLAPFPMKLSRDRVTEEDAEVNFVNPKHKVLYHPNKITKNDFEGWVQERGLYFANEWSNDLSPVLFMNDQNETEKQGSLLIGEYGDGHYIYTGLSFFRQLPAGVSGAYKLLSNLISIE
jgi:hypothetical protein